jgi:hypothetical protein
MTDLAAGEKSIQRKLQRMIDEPIQWWAAPAVEPTQAQMSWSDIGEFKMGGDLAFDGELKFVLWPEDLNQIVIRVENIADLFDGVPESTPQFDLWSFASNLYAFANNGALPESIEFEERTLTNNEAYEDMVTTRFPWKTTDGAGSVVYPVDQEKGKVIALQPQRIRVFRAKYNVKPDLFLA